MAIKLRPTFIPDGYKKDATSLNFAIHITVEEVDTNDANDILSYIDFISDCPFSLINKTSGTEIYISKLDKTQLIQNLLRAFLKPQEIDFSKPAETETLKATQNDIVTFDKERPSDVIRELESLYVHSYTKHFSTTSKNTFLNTNNSKAYPETLIKKISNIELVEADFNRNERNPIKPTLFEILGFINNYPELLQPLGLLFKFDSLPDVNINDTDQIYVALRPNGTNQSFVINPTLSTRINIDKVNKYFGVLRFKKDSPYAKGFLNLNHKVNGIERYEIHQFSAVESAYKLNDANVLQSENGKSKEENLSPLNTNGIYIIDNLREQEKDEIIRSNQNVKDAFYFEDLIIGYNIGIITPDNTFQSLTERKGAFLSNSTELIQINGQGWIDNATSVDQEDGKILLGEIICKYDGWSLTVDNPLQKKALEKAENQIDENGKIIRPLDGDSLTRYLKSKCDIKIKLNARGLKPLRFGEDIRFAIKPVLIGGIIDYAYSDTNILDYTKGIKFLRKESITAPVLILRENIYSNIGNDKRELLSGKEGESAKTLVIRSRDNKNKTNEITERALAPGGISWHVAEYHGVFDDGKTGLPSVTKIMNSVKLLPKWDETCETWVDKRGKFSPNGDKRTKTPYIVDPLSQCFEILYIENGKEKEESLFSLTYAKNNDLKFWDDELDIHNVKIWRIIIKEQKKKLNPGINKGKKCSFGIDWFNRLITINVPKGESLEFVIRSIPKEKNDFNKLLISNDEILNKFVTGSSMTKVIPSSESFCKIRNSNISAEETFKVIHAVQKPLFSPRFIGSTVVQRTWNHADISYALLKSTILYPGKTSQKLELIATWSEKVDDSISQDLTPQKFENVLVDEYKLNGVIEKPSINPSGSDSYVLGEIIDNTELDVNRKIYEDTEKTFIIKHNFGDSKHRIVDYQLKATSRFTQFFPASKDQKTDEFSVYSEKPLTLSIPSSQAPPAPKVAFIIPYFEWEFSKTERRRKGNRLRVYLERPWYSSGEGEKLAVIISNNPKYEEEYEASNANPNGKYHYVSKWGRDVTTFGQNLLPLTANNFANKESVVTNLTINNLLFKKRNSKKQDNAIEITNIIERPFSAIVYNVELETETNCWYADIEFDDVNAYFPFIQLSLARYQKNSIADEELSSSILCDFIQVAPTRTISYHKQGDYIELNLFGTVYKADYDSSKGNTVVKNEVYVAFISKENSQEGNNDILYSLNDDTPNKYDWKKVDDYTILENGIVWKFKDASPYDNYTVLVKEFEIFRNSLSGQINPEKNPTKRLTFGDAIDL